MIKAIQNQDKHTSIVVILLFLYLGFVYFSFAISNILLAISATLFVVLLFSKKIFLRFNKERVILYGFVLIPFILTFISALNSENFSRAFNYLWLRAPLVLVPFIILFMDYSLKVLKKGLIIFVLFTILAALQTVYNAIRYINEEVLLVPDFTFLITAIQHPYFGVYVLIAAVAILEFKLISSKYLKFLIFSLFLCSIVLSTSRLVYILTIIIACYYIFRKLSKKKALVVLLAGVVGVTFLFIQNNGVINKFKTSFNYENSPRLKLWNNAYNVVNNSEAQLFGVGIGDFYTERKEAYFFRESNEGTMGYNPHSQIVEFYVTNGLFGVVVMGVLMVFGFCGLKKQTAFSSIVFLIIVSFLLTECILTRQFGVQLYSIFIPLIFKENLKL